MALLKKKKKSPIILILFLVMTTFHSINWNVALNIKTSFKLFNVKAFKFEFQKRVSEMDIYGQNYNTAI